MGDREWGDVVGVRAERELAEEEADAEAIAGKMFDEIFQRLDVSPFCCSDTMLGADLYRELTQVLNLTWLSDLLSIYIDLSTWVLV